jgi:hypothetical protein
VGAAGAIVNRSWRGRWLALVAACSLWLLAAGASAAPAHMVRVPVPIEIRP